MIEIASSLTGYRRLCRVYDWYEIWQKDVFDEQKGWRRVWRGYDRDVAIRELEHGSQDRPAA